MLWEKIKLCFHFVALTSIAALTVYVWVLVWQTF